MASSDKQKNAERVRWAERERMAQRDHATADSEALDPLTMDGLIPGDTEGLRPASSNDLPLVVNIPAWKNLPPFPNADATVRIEWARVGESTGLDWIVRPYDTKILPLYGGESDQVGRGIVSYTVSGVTSPSPDATLNVALGTGTGVCPITRP